jgi:aspartyl-tRNA(Asn)/glutamyl-tRNA(Gln) amidotransferase subunit A
MAGLSEEVKTCVLEAAETLRSLGAELVEFEMPLIEYAMPAYLAILCAEVSSALSRFDGIRYGYRSPNAATANDIYYKSRTEGFGDEVKRRILLGNLVLSHGYYDDYYKKAVQARGMIRREFEKAFESVDLILSPVCGTTAFELGGRIRDPLAMYAGDTFTASVNLAGLPAASAPCGFSADGLPVGMQLAGRDFGEGAILDTLAHYQQATDFHTRRPKGEAK